MRLIPTFTTIAAGFLLASPSLAQNNPNNREAFFRCRDARGQIQYGDSIPPACQGQDTEVLNRNGMLVRMIEGDATKAQRAQREASETKARTEREQRLQRDRMLIDTYLTVEDIERLRDQRLDLLNAQSRACAIVRVAWRLKSRASSLTAKSRTLLRSRIISRKRWSTR
jgi:hypothetical protein